MNHYRTIGKNASLAWLVLTRVSNWPRVALDLLGLGRMLPNTYVMALRDGSSFTVRTASEDAKELIVVSLTQEYPDDILATLQSTEVIVDVGAHVGAFAIHAKQLNPKVRLFSLELASANFDLLQENIVRNNLTSGVVSERIALSNFDGEAVLSVVDPPGSWAIVRQGRDSATTETV
jgi:tRNA G46 methylase TrmB